MRPEVAILAGGALLAAGGCEGPPAPGQRIWPQLQAARWAPEERPLTRTDDAFLVGAWEGESPGEGWPAPTLTIRESDAILCGNAFMESVEGVFYDERGRAVDITPTLLVTRCSVTGERTLADGSTDWWWHSEEYDGYLVKLDGERYLGLASPGGGFGARALHRWHRIAIRADAIEITWSGASVHWMSGMTALEDSGAEVVGEPGSEVEPKFRSYVTGSLQRFLEFHQRIADREEFWEDRTVWRRVARAAEQTPDGASEFAQSREADGVEAK